MPIEPSQTIELMADFIRVRQTVDGSFVITLGVGEYESERVSEILKIPLDKNLKISVTVQND